MSARAHLETYRISHQAAHCKIHCLEGIADLIHCSSLTCLDLQQNNMRGEPEDMIHLFTSVPSLACLYLQGNPIVGSLQNYRKRMISEISTLTILMTDLFFLSNEFVLRHSPMVASRQNVKRGSIIRCLKTLS